jgi:hypothetical protein
MSEKVTNKVLGYHSHLEITMLPKPVSDYPPLCPDPYHHPAQFNGLFHEVATRSGIT